MKGIKKYSLFLFILLALLYGIQFAIDQAYKHRCTDKVSLLMKHQVDAQLMVFGSSVAYVQFDAAVIGQETGLSAYNMGWDGVFFVQYNGIIKEFLSYETQCKYLVIACDFDNLGKNNLITRPDMYYAYMKNDNIYQSLHDIEPAKMFKAKYLPGYRFTILGKTFYNHFLNGKKDDSEINGFRPRYVPWTGDSTVKKFDARFDSDVYAKFRNTVNEIRKRNISVFIVMPPVYKDGYDRILNSEEIKNRYRTLAGHGVYFMDYTHDSLCNDKSMFYNNSHLNGFGASIFSHKFATDIKAIIGNTK